jgi:hypothetical protein
MAMNAVLQRGTSIALACRTFQISETCYRYSPVLSDENEEIADWLERLGKQSLATVDRTSRGEVGKNFVTAIARKSTFARHSPFPVRLPRVSASNSLALHKKPMVLKISRQPLDDCEGSRVSEVTVC